MNTAPKTRTTQAPVTASSTFSFFTTTDGNGNVTEYVDESGAVKAHYEYGPFGQIIAKSGTKANDFKFRFSSKYYDAETGLLYYGFRYYSPELGRWPSRDPIGERGGLMLYGFVGNAPVGKWDYLGMWTSSVQYYTTDGQGNFDKKSRVLLTSIDSIAVVPIKNLGKAGSFGPVKTSNDKPYIETERAGKNICKINIYLYIAVDAAYPLEKDVPVGTKVGYVDHDVTVRGEVASMTGGYFTSLPLGQAPREAIVAHEMGHAEWFWVSTAMQIKMKMLSYIGSDSSDWLLQSEFSKIFHSESNKRNSSDSANASTFIWFVTHPSWEDYGNPTFGPPDGYADPDFVFEKVR